LERVDGFGERVRYEPLGAQLEFIVGDLSDVVSRREHPVRAGDDYAPRPLELAEGLRDRVENRMVEGVALGWVRDRQPRDALRGFLDDQLAVRELAPGDIGGHRAKANRADPEPPSEISR